MRFDVTMHDSSRYSTHATTQTLVGGNNHHPACCQRDSRHPVTLDTTTHQRCHAGTPDVRR